ncbi:hypothetical protein NKDENANG_01393 [Candidatus Entotheonellaceae bacterium PAL068K]
MAPITIDKNPHGLRERYDKVILRMPDSRRHRSAHPEAAILFGQPENLHKRRVAAGDFAWLLGPH